MLFWFIATAVLTIDFVFTDPRFDYRLLIVGATVPAITDAIGGWATVVSSVTFAAGVLVIVMFATMGQRERRRLMLGLPIGLLLHMVFSGAFVTTLVFWWPFAGVDLAAAPSLLWQRGLISLVLEAVGILGCRHIIRRSHLREPEHRREFLSTGRLEMR
jgi:hypothetical protein